MINMAKKVVDDISRLPAVPDLFYRTEWKGWDDFLGTMYPYDWEIVEIIKFNYNGLGDGTHKLGRGIRVKLGKM